MENKIKIASLKPNSETLSNFNNFIHSQKVESIPTGFEQLDNALNGGLRSGLYLIAAEPGTGKTSYVLQMAEQIASQGTPVFFFSLEMFRYELQAKGIARQSFIMDDKPFTAGDIYTMKEEEYKTAFEKYMELTKDNLYITENLDDGLTDLDIYETVKQYMADLDKAVIVIDYLQLIENKKDGDRKSKVDNVLKTLKRIVREFNVPIICISSVNRSTYTDGNRTVTMGSMKESGNIEFDANAIIGLNNAIKTGKNTKCKVLNADIIKNKMAPAGGTIRLNFYAGYSQFEETAKPVHEKSLKG